MSQSHCLTILLEPSAAVGLNHPARDAAEAEPQGRVAVSLLQGERASINAGWAVRPAVSSFRSWQMNNQFLNYYSNAKSHDILGSINLAEVTSVQVPNTDDGVLELRFKVGAGYEDWAAFIFNVIMLFKTGRWPNVQHSHRAALGRVARSA